ncbi:MAG: hypothetical protein EBY92_02075 [Actinobacteria bacterium]|nr:hypothetical protein [Actinomycetota bacterium]
MAIRASHGGGAHQNLAVVNAHVDVVEGRTAVDDAACSLGHAIGGNCIVRQRIARGATHQDGAPTYE